MPVYKLKNKTTGLYWKGGGIIPFLLPNEVCLGHWGRVSHDIGVKNCWSKTGKSWSSKGAFNSAISHMMSGAIDYFQIGEIKFYCLKDYKVYDIVVKLLETECCVEIYEDPKQVNVFDCYKGLI